MPTLLGIVERHGNQVGQARRDDLFAAGATVGLERPVAPDGADLPARGRGEARPARAGDDRRVLPFDDAAPAHGFSAPPSSQEGPDHEGGDHDERHEHDGHVGRSSAMGTVGVQAHGEIFPGSPGGPARHRVG